MGMKDPILSKNYTGTFTGGEGPILGQEKSSESEYSGVYGGEFKRMKNAEDGGRDVKPSGEDTHFDLHGKNYAGPQNMEPENKGTCNPDDVTRG